MEKQNKQGNWIYIIDEDFKIVYTNLDDLQAKELTNQTCYKTICGEQNQCLKCPLRKENEGTSILFEKILGEWVNVSSSKIEWQGNKNCHLIMCDSVKESEKNYINNHNTSEYSELLKINYFEDQAHVIYHGQRKLPKDRKSFSIKKTIEKIANEKIYQEDRERFYQFWCLDEIGKAGIPHAFNSPRHGEFRKINEDGTFSWVQQILIPMNHASKNVVFAMSYYNHMNLPKSKIKTISLPKNQMLNNIEEFYQKVENHLKDSSPNFVPCIVSIDIEKFNLFNEWYGRDAGDRLLDSIYRCLLELQNTIGGIAGDFGEDDFAFYMEDSEANNRLLYHSIKQVIAKHSGKMNVLPAFGVYRIEDKTMSVFKMYDRAKLACSAVKGNYIVRMKRFEHQMLEAIQSEYLLFTDIRNAFQNNEFYFVLQPKCNMATGQIIGAEALARWRKDKGVISPGIFIPFLEKTGLVTELDTYIWESVCRWQRKMLDEKKDTVPISVNISRIDISSIDIPNHFKELIQKYQLDPKWLELEITESAYAENSEVMNIVVKQLRNQGFRVLMDDFGSAYSSLNMLKDIEIDEIKVDMRFLHFNESNQDRGADILETVCNMAQVLGLEIIAEGVETDEQKALLQDSGCNRGQGYYFYRPMEVDDFQTEMKKVVDTPQIVSSQEFSELFNIKFLLNKNILSQNMLMNMLGAMAFYELKGHQIKIVRYNDKYAEMLGYNASNTKEMMLLEQLLYSEAEYNQIFDVFIQAQQNRHEGASLDVRRKRPDGSDMWLHMRVYFLYQRNGRSIFYSNVMDVTAVHHSNLALNFLNNDMPGGYYRHRNNADADFTFVSQRFLDIFGYTRQEIKELFDDKFINMVHPDDREIVCQEVLLAEKTYGNYSMPCRMRSKNGYIYVLDQSRLVKFENKEVFQGIIITDVDHFMWLNNDATNTTQKNQATTLMPCGVFQVEVDTHQFSYISNSMLHMLGYSRHDFEKKFDNSISNLIYSGDLERVQFEIDEQLKKGIYISCEYRIELADGSLMWVYSQSRLVTDPNGKRWFYTCIVDYNYLKKKYQIQDWQFMKYKSLIEIPGYFVYDYDPATDIFTLNLTQEDGQQGTIQVDHYLYDIENNGIVAPEFIETQKQNLRKAMNEPLRGVTEFRADFNGNHEMEWYRFNYISLANETGEIYRIVGRGKNITKEKERMDHLQQQAMRDSLTGLLNFESAKRIATNILSEQQKGILYLFDLDNFKEVNDTLGHLAGDKLLIHFAKMLNQIFDQDALIARFGGDEFIVFMPNAQQEKLTHKAEVLLNEVSSIQLPENLQASTSIGIAVIDDARITFEDLFQKADNALYQSKKNGKNCYSLCS